MQGPNDTLGIYTFPPGAGPNDPRIVIDGLHGKITQYIKTQGGALISSVLSPEFSSANGHPVSGTVAGQPVSDQFAVPANDALAPALSNVTSYRVRAWGNGNVGSPVDTLVMGITSNTANENVLVSPGSVANDSFFFIAEGVIQLNGPPGAGATATYITDLRTAGGTAGGTFPQSFLAVASQSFNTTIAQLIGLTGNWQGSTGTLTCLGSSFQRFGP